MQKPSKFATIAFLMCRRHIVWAAVLVFVCVSVGADPASAEETQRRHPFGLSIPDISTLLPPVGATSVPFLLTYSTEAAEIPDATLPNLPFTDPLIDLTLSEPVGLWTVLFTLSGYFNVGLAGGDINAAIDLACRLNASSLDGESLTPVNNEFRLTTLVPDDTNGIPRNIPFSWQSAWLGDFPAELEVKCGLLPVTSETVGDVILAPSLLTVQGYPAE